jgi:TonB family protein
VKVLVDARGRVTKAESLAEGNPLVQYLARAAVDAAREWQFIPSRQGNRNIPGEAVLEFEFKR